MKGNDSAGGGPEIDARLYEAFGDEVEMLSISASPIGAVLRDGVALRKRRRVAWSGSVAGLLVLPVAAVVVFGGGPAVDQAGKVKATPRPTATAPSPTVSASESPTPSRTATPTTTTRPNRPNRPGSTEPPDPHDTIDVVGSGTVDGTPWRLVRDRFAARSGAMSSQHFPFADGGKNGLERCEFTGVQFGDAPAGSRPDFNAGGACGAGNDLRTTPAGLNDDDSSGLYPWAAGESAEGVVVSGALDPTKVATFDVTVDGVRKVDPTPVFQRAGDPMGYYAAALPIPGVHSVDEHHIVVEFRDTQGKVVGQYSPTQTFLQPSHAGPTK